MRIRAKHLHVAEALTNVVVGYLINIFVVYAILHAIGREITLGQNAAMGVFLAVVSFIRGYFVRRTFNNLIKKVYNGKT